MAEYISKINLYKKSSGKIAGFDLDSTLIKTKSGRVRPKDKDDWQFYINNLKDVLLELQKDDFNIIIFTNQSGLDGNENKKKDFMYKLNSILFDLGSQLKISYFVLIGYNRYRKPMIGSIEVLEKEMKINYDKSFYCGDACGRPVGWKYFYNGVEYVNKKKDFSASDLYFAVNCGLKIYTPEEFFFNRISNDFECDEVKLPDRPFLNYMKNKNKKEDNVNLILNKDKKYLIVMIGLPASGKSFLSNKIKNDYEDFNFEIVNKDLLKTKKKNNNLFEELVNKNRNIIIDNTNLVRKDRDYYINYLKKNNLIDEYNVIAMHLTTDFGIINQMNYYRCYFTGTFIKSVVYNTMKKRADTSKLNEEGFNNIVEYNYKPIFKNKGEKKIFLMYY